MTTVLVILIIISAVGVIKALAGVFRSSDVDKESSSIRTRRFRGRF